MEEDIEYLTKEKRRLTQLVNGMLDIIERFGYGPSGIDVQDLLNGIIDHEKDNDPATVNAAKYCNYWLEKSCIIDDPEINKYNDYKEEV